MLIIALIEAETGFDGKKYNEVEDTESCRLMRGTSESWFEYIPELHTEFVFYSEDFFEYPIVGCDVVAHVNRAGVLSDTHEGKQCKLFMN